MNSVTSVRNVSVTMTVLLFAALAARAQHGGHGSEVSSAPTATDVADAIEDYVRHDTKMKGGYFLVYDPMQRAPLVLTLDRVREDGLRMLEDGMFFTCVDLTAADGKIYDLDIFVKGSDKNQLEIASMSVHMESGTPRYDWRQRDGVWARRQIPPAGRHP